MNRQPVHVTTFGDLVVAAAQRRPEKTAVAFTDTRVSAAELLERCVTTARSLHALGVRRGDRVAIVMPNCMEYVDALFGASLLGAVVVTINARYRATELAYVLADSDASVLLTSDVLPEVDFVGLLYEALPGLAEARDPAALDARRDALAAGLRDGGRSLAPRVPRPGRLRRAGGLRPGGRRRRPPARVSASATRRS